VSYDLAVWEGDRPADDVAAGETFEQLYSRYLDKEWQTPATPRLAAYVEALLDRWVDLTADDDEDLSPFAAGPVRDEASGRLIYFAMSYSRARVVSASAAVLAAEHGLVCFDPQYGRLRPTAEDVARTAAQRADE
jgi:hypothetical protein